MVFCFLFSIFPLLLLVHHCQFLCFFFSRRRAADFYLGCFLLSLSMICIYGFLASSERFAHFSDFILIAWAFVFLAAPSSFLYIKNMLYGKGGFGRYDWLHFLPFGTCMLLAVLVNGGILANFITVNHAQMQSKNFYLTLTPAMVLCYLLLQNLLILKCSSKRAIPYSYSEFRKLEWLRLHNASVVVLFSFFCMENLRPAPELLASYSSAATAAVLFFSSGWLYF